MMNRRDFLKSIALASTAPLWIRFSEIGATAAEGTPLPLPSHMLLVLFLNGGNDGLNTVVPYLDGAYKSARPTIGLAPSDVVPIGGGLGIHKSLERVAGMWSTGNLAIVHNVGYPNPNFSHFDSTQIWETASPDFRYHTGWLGRYLDATDGPNAGPVRAVAIGTGGLPRTLVGQDSSGVSLNGLSDFSFADDGRGDAPMRRSAYGAFAAGSVDDGSMRTAILKAQDTATKAVSVVGQVREGITEPLTEAETVAHMFSAGVGTEIGFIQVGGFDTHTTQNALHAQQLAEVDNAIRSFFSAANTLGLADRATVMTFSDFGRRVGENASNGTDHGSSMPVLVMGPRVNGGVYGARPDLTDLQDGNLKPSINFGSVYSSVIAQGFGVDPVPIIGAEFPLLPLIS